MQCLEIRQKGGGMYHALLEYYLSDGRTQGFSYSLGAAPAFDLLISIETGSDFVKLQVNLQIFFSIIEPYDFWLVEMGAPNVIVLLPCRILTSFISNLANLTSIVLSASNYTVPQSLFELAFTSCCFPHS